MCWVLFFSKLMFSKLFFCKLVCWKLFFLKLWCSFLSKVCGLKLGFSKLFFFSRLS